MSAHRHVNKTTFLHSGVCPTRGWYVRNLKHAVAPSAADVLRKDEGIEIGRRAQLLYPDGVLVPSQKSESAAEQTDRLMADRNVSAIFEATFCVEGYVAKADILVRGKLGWHLLEVKSSINKRWGLVEDLAYTAMVAKRAGATIERTSLLLLSGKYSLGDPDGELFVEHDCTSDIADMIPQFEVLWDSIRKTALAKQPPEPRLVLACGKCEFYPTDCLGKDKPHTIFKLPRLNQQTFERLAQHQVTMIADIPAAFQLTPAQKRVQQAIATGQPVIDTTALASFLSSLVWPAFYLDFETVKSAIPLFPGTAPHEQVVTQYSIHVRTAPGEVCEHRQFLTEPSRDGRRGLAERLLQDLEDAGHIVVYSSFEKTMLNKLGDLFGDLQTALDRCVDRLFDLEEAFKNCYCHPNFNGRTSIKATLPALVDLSYDGLAIADGDTAIASYARMARGEITGKAADEVCQALSDYCERDTLAMVKLHEKLLELSR